MSHTLDNTRGDGRPNQRRRTRKDLLQAAARLMKTGRTPSLEEIAAEALVSRATAYRYFPSVDALLAEASVDIVIPDPVELFPEGSPEDPVMRVQRVDTLLHDTVLANEPALRMMLVHSLQRRLRAPAPASLASSPTPAEGPDEPPARQNRRTPLIEAALAPARRQFTTASLETLTRALALVVGTEAMVVFKDVLQLPDAEARKVKRWAIRALIEAARKSPRPAA